MDTETSRDRKNPAVDVTVSDDLPRGWSYASFEVPIVYGQESNLIHERVSPDEQGPRSSWKSFEHHKVISTAWQGGSSAEVDRVTWWPIDNWVPVTFDSPYAFYAGQFGEPGMFNLNLPQYASLGDQAGHFVNDPFDLQSLVGRAVQSLLPTMKPEVSLVNSIIELKDFKSIGRSLAGINKLQKSIGLVPGVKAALAGKASLRDILRLATKLLYPTLSSSEKKKFKWVSWQGAKVLADAYLQKKFNIDPLIADIKGIQSSLSTCERRLRRLINRAGSARTCHYTHNFAEFPDLDEDTGKVAVPTINGWCGFRTHCAPLWWNRKVVNSPTTFHAEICYSYSLSDFQLAHAQVLGWLDTVGINMNPVIIWNAIPWSFVVDWCLGVNTWLNAQRFGNMDPVLNIHKFLYSVKRSRSIYVTRYTGVGSAETPRISGSNCPVVTETSYRRYAGENPDPAYFRVSGLSSSEVRLGVALGVSLHNPFKKRR